MDMNQEYYDAEFAAMTADVEIKVSNRVQRELDGNDRIMNALESAFASEVTKYAAAYGDAIQERRDNGDDPAVGEQR
jgi:hypothetical protein